jgi:hypothetical protein
MASVAEPIHGGCVNTRRTLSDHRRRLACCSICLAHTPSHTNRSCDTWHRHRSDRLDMTQSAECSGTSWDRQMARRTRTRRSVSQPASRHRTAAGAPSRSRFSEWGRRRRSSGRSYQRLPDWDCPPVRPARHRRLNPGPVDARHPSCHSRRHPLPGFPSIRHPREYSSIRSPRGECSPSLPRPESPSRCCSARLLRRLLAVLLRATPGPGARSNLRRNGTPRARTPQLPLPAPSPHAANCRCASPQTVKKPCSLLPATLHSFKPSELERKGPRGPS